MEDISYNTAFYSNYTSLNNSADTGEESISSLTNINKIIKINTQLNGKSKSQPKKTNSIKVNRPENTLNSFSNFCKSKTFEPKSSNLYLYQNILIENVPVTAKVTNIPKNDKLSKILKKINFKIDKQTFLRIKYNRIKGVLYIKFRNKIYYNYYYLNLNKKHYYKGLPCINITKVKNNINIWDIDPQSEEEKIYKINYKKKKNNFFYSLIYDEYKDYNL